jgi:hypothetical protein
MFTTKIRAITVAIVVGFLATAPTLSADEGGTFSIIRSYVRTHTTLEHAVGTVTAGTLEGTVTTLASSGEPFTEGDHSLVTCVFYGKSTAEGVSLEAPCATIDGSGDQWYTLSQRSVGDTATGGGGEGRWQIMGGTGKYAGMTGTCTYDTSYVTQDRVVTTGKCTWERS